MTLATVFGTSSSLSVGQECARAALVFAYGFLLVRVAGRRIFGKWSAIDIIVSVIIGSSLSRMMTGNAPLIGTLAATGAMVAIHWLMTQLAARWSVMSRVVEGRGVDIARDGKIDVDACTRHGVSDADIDEALRGSGIRRIEDTELVTLEPSGRISILTAR